MSSRPDYRFLVNKSSDDLAALARNANIRGQARRAIIAELNRRLDTARNTG